MNFKRIGLLKITKKIGATNYELSLLNTIKICSKVFYILLLKLVLKIIPIDNNIKAEDEEEEFKVEKILNLEEYTDNRSRKQVKYLIK